MEGLSVARTALIVGGVPQVVAIIEFTLASQGFTTSVATDSADAVRRVRTSEVDLVVVDSLMPDVDGVPLCRAIREISDGAIMMVSTMDEPTAVIAGLEQGADDYLITPFHPRELALRAGSLVRRSPCRRVECRGEGPTTGPGPVQIDAVRQIASIAGQRIDLSYTEFRLLSHLAAHRGVPQPWRALLKVVWGAQNLAGGRDIVKSAVYRLRSRLAALDEDTDFIVTVRGVGYLMPDQGADPQPDADRPLIVATTRLSSVV